MELFREKYRWVVFVYVSDDMEWGRQRLLPGGLTAGLQGLHCPGPGGRLRFVAAVPV